MKFLIAAIAASLVFPAAVSAETWWLMVGGSDYGTTLQKVPLYTEEECEAAGKKLYDSKELDPPYNIHARHVINSLRYMCIKGK